MRNPMKTHTQIWVKVNAPVDEGVADIVCALNQVEGLATLQSCQGESGQAEGYVYFFCGDWKRVSELVFKRIGPKLKAILGADVHLTVEATSADEPMAKLSFKAEAASSVASALKDGLGLGASEAIGLLVARDAKGFTVA